MQRIRVFALAAVLAATSAGTALAAGLSLDEVTKGWVDVHALVATDYQYSFNTPDSRFLPYRVIAKNDNTFELNDAAIFVGRQHADEDFGFAVNMDFGQTAQYTASDWNGDGVLNNSDESDNFELREAYGTYKLPLELPAGKPTLKAGKFVTLLGYEVLKTWSNFNPNITHSILFGFAIPFTHTGLLLNVPVIEGLGVDIGVVNGWDNVADNNRGKTLLLGVGYTPLDILTSYFAFSYGNEVNGVEGFVNTPTVCYENDPVAGTNGLNCGAGVKRAVVTANATVKATDYLSFVIDGVYGNESDRVLSYNTGNPRSADWFGAAGYIIVNPIDDLTLALRAEVFDDSDGTRNFSGQAATLWEITPTIAYNVLENVMVRAEYRHDEANKQIYEKDFRFQRGADGVLGEVLVHF